MTQRKNNSYTGEAFIVKALGTDERGQRIIKTEYYEVREGDDPDKILEKAHSAQGYLKFQKGFDFVYVYHAYLMRWDGQKLADHEALRGN